MMSFWVNFIKLFSLNLFHFPSLRKSSCYIRINTYRTSDDRIDDIIVWTKNDIGGFEQQSCTIIRARMFLLAQTHNVLDIPNGRHSKPGQLIVGAYFQATVIEKTTPVDFRSKFQRISQSLKRYKLIDLFGCYYSITVEYKRIFLNKDYTYV